MPPESEQNLGVIRLRFVRHPGIFSALVQYAQFGFPQTHCEAILPKDQGVIGAWFKGGSQLKGVGYDAGEFSNELLFDIRCTKQQEDDFYGFLIHHLYAPYDWQAIIAFAAGRDWQEPDSWFCSEIIAAALVHSLPGFDILPTNKVTVKDLALLVHSYVVLARNAE